MIGLDLCVVDTKRHDPLQEEGDVGRRQAGPEDDLAAEKDAVIVGVCGNGGPSLALESLLGFQELRGFNVVLQWKLSTIFFECSKHSNGKIEICQRKYSIGICQVRLWNILNIFLDYGKHII
jgi:hypothetical protein